jgi:hypothetical protein
MALDPKTIRILSRLTDRMDLIRKHPHRYEIAADDLQLLMPVAEQLETLLSSIKIIKAG